VLGINGTENRVKATRVSQIRWSQTSGDILQRIGRIAKGSKLSPRSIDPQDPLSGLTRALSFEQFLHGGRSEKQCAKLLILHVSRD
jgi:hypothetical protein